VPLGVPREPTKSSAIGRVKGAMPRVLVELAQLAYNVRSLWQLIVTLRRRRYDFIYERYALYNIAGLIAARMFGLVLILEVNTPYARHGEILRLAICTVGARARALYLSQGGRHHHGD